MTDNKISSRYAVWRACLFLTAMVFVVYGQVYKHKFINADDPDYVTQNEQVQKGLSRESIAWAFTTFHASNWHPLTWLSLMLDYQLFGLNAGGFHITNVLLHTANTLLLFLILRQMTGAIYRSCFAALLFAIHPLHVESVAWVAERKDVLSTLLWLLTMWAYIGYVQHSGIRQYLVVVLLFILGLMAKPMLVTLPFVLLLLDYWPLMRFRNNKTGKIILEKIPLFALSAISVVITIAAQRSGGAVISIKSLPAGWRISNAIVSYAVYILKTFAPLKLGAFYPNMSPPPFAAAIGSALLLAGITIAVVMGMRQRRYLVTGWLWYLGTLVPVIGIMQVGAQAYADRYTYIPLTGLFIIVAWLIPDLLAKQRYKKSIIAACMCITVIPMTIISVMQVRRWQDTFTLFEYTLTVTKDNCVAHNALANTYGDEGQIDKSIYHSEEALRIFPDYKQAHYNLAMGYYAKGKIREAIKQWQDVVRLDENFKEANFNLGVAFEKLGEFDKAAEYFRKELTINPKHKQAQDRLKSLLAKHPELGQK
jgi:tetratricopeptide (TPR) repeat protein